VDKSARVHAEKPSPQKHQCAAYIPVERSLLGKTTGPCLCA
jgi:hypothetical protein